MNPWVDWVKQIKSISQAGLAYSKAPFDIERFKMLDALAHEMFSHLSTAPVEQVERLFIPETGYPTPKIDLRAGVIREGKILLVRERADGCWSLPGGWADVCETASEGVVREVMEETGYRVSQPRLIAVKDRARHGYRPEFPYHIYKLFFVCEFESGMAETNIEISDIGFFAPDELPELSVSRVLPEDIEMLFRHSQCPGSPVYVD